LTISLTSSLEAFAKKSFTDSLKNLASSCKVLAIAFFCSSQERELFILSISLFKSSFCFLNFSENFTKVALSKFHSI